MHGFEEFQSDEKPDEKASQGPWWKELNRYHWFVLIVAALGWLFDCLDQQLFNLSRPAAMRELIVAREGEDSKALEIRRSNYGGLATSIFIAGWATGGLVFGVLGDRWGRAKTMMITILLYSAFTGLSALSQGFWDFAFYRFLTGLGVGGEFAVGVSLVAEVMPSRARPHALSLLQALSAIGNISAAFINLGLGLMEGDGLPTSPWRIMFLIGALPALLALVIRRNLKEPETWQKSQQEGVAKKPAASYPELFRHPVWRKHAILGLILGCSGVLGLWSLGFFTTDLIMSVQRPSVTAAIHQEALSSATGAQAAQVQAIIDATRDIALEKDFDEETRELKKKLDKKISSQLSRWSSFAAMAIQIGAFLGMYVFGPVSQRIGRKPTFTIALLAAMLSTAMVFAYMKEFWHIWVMLPIMGFFQLSLFGGYAIYFPELFPTRLRSTGTSFCYNVGRFVAAFGPIIKGMIEHQFKGSAEPIRDAGVTMCAVFLIGLFVLPFLPETKGKPLPEE